MTDAAALFVGEGSWDITQRIPRLPGIDEKINSIAFIESSGGVAANASVACARSGTASRALLRLGRDTAAGLIIDSLAEAGVEAVADSGDGVTTRATILLEPHGEKRLLLFGGAGLYPSIAAVEAVDLTKIRWVHTTLYDPDAAAVLIARCRAQQIPVSIDLEPGSFKTLDAVSVHLCNTQVVFANDKTHERLGDAVAALISLGVLSVIRTRGPQGASWHDHEMSQCIAAPLASIVDTTGAGDCLAGWFIGETIAGHIVPEALRRAVHAATLSCAQLGSNRAYPTSQAVEQSLQKGSI